MGSAVKFYPRNLEKLLHEKLGDLKMSELIKPCLITTYNMAQKSSFFFTSIEDTAKREFFVHDVLRSTSAAPTYFPPAKIKNLATGPQKETSCNSMINLDGGVFANNPTMCAYAEARNTNFKERAVNEPSATDMHILTMFVLNMKTILKIGIFWDNISKSDGDRNISIYDTTILKFL